MRLWSFVASGVKRLIGGFVVRDEWLAIGYEWRAIGV